MSECKLIVLQATLLLSANDCAEFFVTCRDVEGNLKKIERFIKLLRADN